MQLWFIEVTPISPKNIKDFLAAIPLTAPFHAILVFQFLMIISFCLFQRKIFLLSLILVIFNENLTITLNL